MFDFEIKIAKTQGEIQAAQRLRFEVFKPQASKIENVQSRQERDIDKYDAYCDHLIIIDKTVESIIATYRLLLKSKVNERIGFHAEQIFNIDNIKRLKGELLELGRSCIHSNYRRVAVINLLWTGLAEYIKQYQVKYIFGCPRITDSSDKDISQLMDYLKAKHYSHDMFRVFPHKKNVIELIKKDTYKEGLSRIYQQLPPLVKGYLNLGAVVCAEPAIYEQFNSIVVFMLLAIEEIKPTYRRHFLGS